MGSKEEVILKTLLYSDIFNYPLTKEELYNFLPQKIAYNKFLQVFKSPLRQIEFNQEFFFLKGNKEIVKLRQTRELISLQKFKKAEQIIKKLSFIPTIKFIGISGSLAMKNSDTDDDMDIFIISGKRFAWTTRFLSACMLIVLGAYRNKNSKNVQDKICLNLILSESETHFKTEDLFTAHEIVQLLPIFDRDKTYAKFIDSNKWIGTFLPNAQLDKKPLFEKQTNGIDKIIIFFYKILFLEKLLQTAQLFYMRKAITKERLENGFIGLHPFDYRLDILRKYNTRLIKFGLK